MLVLSRKKSESVVLNFDKVKELIDVDPEAAKAALSDMTVMLVEIRSDKSRLGIAADSLITVHRREVFDAIQREKQGEAEGGAA